MLPARLKIALGQHSHRGRKEINQDFHGACIPEEPQLTAKGIAVALADGVSSSNVSQIASEATVKSFLDDYYCTSGAWSVRQSAQRVLMAINSWLYAQTRQSQYRYDQDRGYVCTVSAVVIKSRSNSRSRRSWTISICRSPRKPHRKPKPSAVELSGS